MTIVICHNCHFSQKRCGDALADSEKSRTFADRNTKERIMNSKLLKLDEPCKVIYAGGRIGRHADDIRAFDCQDFARFLDHFFTAIHLRYDIEKPHIRRYIRRRLKKLQKT